MTAESTQELRAHCAIYASDPGVSRGRRFAEASAGERSAFERDRDRILHSTAFRRLKDKTQVFLYDEGDHYRTRLTHSLEVSQIARALARLLRLNEDLAEALALAHDLGHPPFGHAGERALAAAMADHGGFDHNAQSLRVVTLLERRYPRFDGLNLTWEALEGLVKHNGPLLDAGGEHAALPFGIAEYAAVQDLRLHTFASAEAQAAAIADDIAYNAHDIDDGLRSGLLTLEALADVPVAGNIIAEVRREYPSLGIERLRAEMVRRLIRNMIEDVTAESRKRLAALAPSSADDVRGARAPVVCFSEKLAAADIAIKARLRREVYRHPDVMAVMLRAESVVLHLFSHYSEDIGRLPGPWRPDDEADGTRAVADFIAGMTDRYALAEYARIFGRAPELR